MFIVLWLLSITRIFFGSYLVPFDSDIMQKQGLVLEWRKRRNRWWDM